MLGKLGSKDGSMQKKNLMVGVCLVLIVLSTLITIPGIYCMHSQPRITTTVSYKTFALPLQNSTIDCIVKETLIETYWPMNGSTTVNYTATIENPKYIKELNIGGATIRWTTVKKPRSLYLEVPTDPHIQSPVEFGMWDGLWTVKPPGNVSYRVKYEYTDNLFHYPAEENPGHFNESWSIPGDEKLHVHLADWEIDDWKDSLKNEAILLGAFAAGSWIVLGFALGKVGALKAAAVFLGCSVGLVTLIVSIAGFALDAWIAWYYLHKINWIEDVVETYYFDGWCYIWETYTHTHRYWRIRPDYIASPEGPTAHSWMCYTTCYRISWGAWRDSPAWDCTLTWWVDCGGGRGDVYACLF